MKQAALLGLRRYFHPLIGGEDAGPETDGSGWPFGGDISYSLVLQRLIVAGVKRVAKLEIELEGETYPVCTDVSLDAHMLLRNGAHEIAVRYEEGT